MKKKYKLETCVPIFNKDNIGYKRKEEDGTYLMISNKHPELQQLTYNKTTMLVINLCDGKTTIEKIIKRINNIYSDVLPKTIQEDVINILHILWKLGFIGWINQNPFAHLYSKKMEGVEFRLLSEEESVEYMMAKEPMYMSPLAIKNMNYTQSVIKQNVFAFYESYFLISDGKGQKFLISLIIPLGNQAYFKIGVMDGNPEVLNSFNNEEFWSWTRNIISTLYQLPQQATGVVLYEEKGAGWGNVLQMEYCGTHEKEIDIQDIDVYSYLYVH